MAIRRDDLTVGKTVSLYQYVLSTPGHLPHTKGKEPTAVQYTCGPLFVDHRSKFIFIYNQVYLGAAETLVAEQAFESIPKSFSLPVLNYLGLSLT